MPYYVNFRGAEGVETIDEFDTFREARDAAREYNMNQSYGGAAYVSQRATREWRQSQAMDALLADSADVI